MEKFISILGACVFILGTQVVLSAGSDKNEKASPATSQGRLQIDIGHLSLSAYRDLFALARDARLPLYRKLVEAFNEDEDQKRREAVLREELKFLMAKKMSKGSSAFFHDQFDKYKQAFLHALKVKAISSMVLQMMEDKEQLAGVRLAAAECLGRIGNPKESQTALAFCKRFVAYVEELADLDKAGERAGVGGKVDKIHDALDAMGFEPKDLVSCGRFALHCTDVDYIRKCIQFFLIPEEEPAYAWLINELKAQDSEKARGLLRQIADLDTSKLGRFLYDPDGEESDRVRVVYSLEVVNRAREALGMPVLTKNEYSAKHSRILDKQRSPTKHNDP